MAILGIDLGTSSVKVIVLDTQERTLKTMWHLERSGYLQLPLMIP